MVRIEITDDIDDGKLLQTKLYDRPFKKTAYQGMHL
jgi:hypothetical protein